MKQLRTIFVVALGALTIAACNTTNEQVLQNESQNANNLNKKGQQGPPAPLTSEDFYYDNPACVGEDHLFTLEGTEGENLQVQIWDETVNDWVPIFQESKGEDATTTFTHTFTTAGTFELRAKIGGGGYTEGFFIDVENCGCDIQEETAWAAGDRYVDPGNWATYTGYDGSATSVTLFAGQHHEAGTVEFSAPDANGNVTITITLDPDWDFQDVEENVKIQDYEVAPSGNPAPGQFDHKGDGSGSTFSIEVPENNFYGVHVDVQTCE